MEKWFVRTKAADFQAWARELHVDPVIARLLRNRGVMSKEEAKEFLYGDRRQCHSPWKLKDMDLAVKYLICALEKGQRIRVIGDYDVDGICASYILTKGIGLLGGNVDVAIPHRIHDGYGLNDHLIQKASEDGVNLIVTCDNGISAADQVALAKELGMDVIITDHHEVPYETEGENRVERLPGALAVVDPKREEDTYPFAGICGAVVAYKYMQAASELLSKSEGFRQRAVALQAEMDDLLVFAAFATVCDVMELRDENRIFVKEGIRCAANTGNLGFRALMDVCAVTPDRLSSYHFGFVLGPCLNATGRLDTAQKALELLNCQEKAQAVTVARELKDLNDSRKNLTIEGVEQANRVLTEQGLLGDKVYVVYLPKLHESLAGIVAGRIRERFGHPTFILTKGEEGVKGSGRSIEQYHMFEALTEVKHLLTRYGGHKQAAGLSLEEGRIDALREALNDNCTLSEEDFIPSVYIDMEMPLSYPTVKLAEEIQLLEPFGTGNARPLFVQRDVIFTAAVRMGKEQRFGRFQVRTADGQKRTMVYFGDMDLFLDALDQKYGAGSGEKLMGAAAEYKMHVVYQIAVNEYMGRRELQFQIKNYQ